MTPGEFKEAVKAMGLNVHSSRKVFLVDERTVRRWSSGDVPIPLPIAGFARVLVRSALPLEWVKDVAGQALWIGYEKDTPQKIYDLVARTAKKTRRRAVAAA
jgi:hypothetical protein